MILPTVLFACLSLLAAIASLNSFIAFRSQPSLAFTVVEVLAIYIPISIVFLLPIDILSSNDDGDGPHNVFFVEPKNVLIFWKLDYWSAFVLMWLFLPLIQEYYRSGEFTPMAKLKDSIKSNIKFQLIVGGIGGVGLIYFFVQYGFNFQSFKDLLIALSHTYSLVLSLWLMSYGLISVPRRLWNNNVNLAHQLDHLYIEMPKLYDELNDSSYNYKDICSIIKSCEQIPGIEQSVFKFEIQELSKQVPSDLNLGNHVRSTQYTSIQQLSHVTLAKLQRTLKQETTNYQSAQFEFEKAKKRCIQLQDIVDSKSTGSLRFRIGTNIIRNEKVNYAIHVYALPILRIAFALVLFALSFIVIESELLHSTRFSIINIILVSGKLSSTVKLIFSSTVLAYMVFCALISLTRIKIFKVYHLFPKYSNPVSVVFFTMYSNRLTVPLSYNFLTLLQSQRVRSVFNDFLGASINLSVLGGFFNSTLPRLIIIPILFASFNVFDKIKKKLWFDYFDAFDSDDEEGHNESVQSRKDTLIADGKGIIQRELGANSIGRTAMSGLSYPELITTPRPNESSSTANDDLLESENFDNAETSATSEGFFSKVKGFLNRSGSSNATLQIGNDDII